MLFLIFRALHHQAGINLFHSILLQDQGVSRVHFLPMQVEDHILPDQECNNLDQECNNLDNIHHLDHMHLQDFKGLLANSHQLLLSLELVKVSDIP